MSEIFEYFFDAYFHQDWRDDYESTLAVVEGFKNAEPTESVVQLVQELKELLSKEDLLQDTFNKLGGNFKPESEGMSVAEWVVRALEVLDR
ncbi:contact-dependent growth inhibition system immunity protein [Spartinivicinus poritis]|uniref:Contact-dependent growth inhibition system immunity protein n=1 Tax=Spartinivicinus poritis TaxID=2994640 RepID=A0ABT5UB53_9GAMM|nr:contact-dependent growth inhibition system immunity protein [Spartinivicinus sp. A2-2]MDE1463547.1 contact-dependent growth inhibition system immunity protein [Spartinivicinus sp. A2-2]